LLSKGRVINLVGGEGHSPEVMALSFGNQLLSILYIIKNYKKMENQLYSVPANIDNIIAKYALESFGIKIDKLTKDQIDYHKNIEI
jgi:adenosylhomocysteinase